ncbi:hypothetical protein BN946_scf184635.g2 [Trametes cinnabarina]|uniref:Integrase catalytic domain-containing protein n=1 Tax=Pycnoporus cinnabarinus TaxID=5643 RepID=A0A060SUG9_PYCCI|nr:hypothetical protein BN946_scf184635.g2 [Trametes cinnabarina]
MSSDLITRAKVQPLDTVEDWSTWETQMEDLLWEAKLWPYVSGKKAKPKKEKGDRDQVKNVKEIEEWEEKDRTALSTIRLRVSKRVIKLIKNVRTSQEAWEKLRKNFETRGLGKIIEVRRKLVSARYSDGEDLDEWLQQMVEWREDLVSLGRDIPDDEFSIMLLAALPESWQAFVALFRDDEIGDADKVQGRIREHARRIQASDSALVIKQKRSGSGPRCYKCGKPGLKRDCPNHEKKEKSGGGSSKGKDEGKERKGGGNKAMVAEGSDNDSNYSCAAIEDVSAVGELALPTMSDNVWIADLGTTSHVARERQMFFEYTNTPGRTLHGAGTTPILGQGSIRMKFMHNGRATTMTLKNVLHAPGVPYNLLSVGRVEAVGHKVEIDGREIRLRNEKGRVYALGKRIGNFLYQIKGEIERDVAYAAAVSHPKRKKTLNEWHHILGHPGMKTVVAMWKKGLVRGMEVDESEAPDEQCEACVRGKQTTVPYPKQSETIVEEIGDLAVMDTWGEASTQGLKGERYFWAFTDVKSRWSEVAFGRHKSEVFEHFKAYKALVENKFGRKLKKIRCDNGGEFLSNEFKSFLRSEGIALDTTAPESSAQNGIAERLHRTVLDRARAMRIAAELPKCLWPQAVAHVIYLKNRLPMRALNGRTPYEVWMGEKPDVGNLQEWGTRCWVLTSSEKRSKLDPRSEPMHFVGLAPGSKAWLYYDSKGRRVGKLCNIVFAVLKKTTTATEDDNVDLFKLSAPLEGEKGSNGKRTEQTESQVTALPPTVTQTPKEPRHTHDVPERRQLRAVPRIDFKIFGDTGKKVPIEEEACDEAHVACILTLVGTESVLEPHNLREAQE